MSHLEGQLERASKMIRQLVSIPTYKNVYLRIDFVVEPSNDILDLLLELWFILFQSPIDEPLVLLF
jgi:hypothetical protein